MKKVTIALPEEMIAKVHRLARKMSKEDFWTLAITWRKLIKKGLAYFDKNDEKKKKGSSKAKTNKKPKDQREYTPAPKDKQSPEEIQKEINETLNKLYPEDKK